MAGLCSPLPAFRPPVDRRLLRNVILMAKKPRKYRFERRRAKRMRPVPFRDSHGKTVRYDRRRDSKDRKISAGRPFLAGLLGNLKHLFQDLFNTRSSTKLSR